MNTATPTRISPPTLQLSSGDELALSRGIHCSMYNYLGAHLVEENHIPGTRFSVWAPNAREVCVLNDDNAWQHGAFYLHGSNSGIWSGFIPHVKPGTVYKYSLRTQSGDIIEKSDPFAFYAEQSPKTASIVYDLHNAHQWDDMQWMHNRRHTNWLEQPISVYECHLGSWKRPKDGRKYFNYRELAVMFTEYCHKMGYTHLELMPITEHPFDGSWGYQTTGYFAPTSRFGTPADFMFFIDYLHQHNIGIIVDWVPAHFPTDAHSLGRFDGTALYEHADPRKGFHPDWNTFIFNYGRFEVKDFLLSSARFWFDKYHIDGIRVDAVASMLYLDYSRNEGEWIPNQYGGRENLEAIQFLKDMNIALHGEFPGILTIAEESTAWGGVSRPVYDGGLGFSMKWDMGWMNDTLRYIHLDPIHRKYHQNDLSFRMIYAFSENFMLPLSHDEVVHGKRSLLSQMPGDYWQQFANLRLLLGYQYCMPGKKLNFMGYEMAMWHEWNHDAELDWSLLGQPHHDGIMRYIEDCNRIYRAHPALFEIDFKEEGFGWIQADDSTNSVYAFSRHSLKSVSLPTSPLPPGEGQGEGSPSFSSSTIARSVSEGPLPPPGETLICIFNCTPVPRHHYRIGVPTAGSYTEILNSDAEIYGGTNIGNLGQVTTDPIPMHGHGQSVELNLPPLGMLILKLV